MTDHLLSATNGIPLKLEVPFVCKERYSIGNFLLYPSTRGFDFNRNGFLEVRDDQYAELPSLLQEWLYFGLLEEFLERSVDIEKFVSTNSDGTAILNTLPLTTYLHGWPGWGSNTESSAFSRLTFLVGEASKQCQLLDRSSEVATPSSLPTIFLSIHFLIDTLVIAATEFDGSIDLKTERQHLPLLAEQDYSPESTSILLGHMVQNGCCVHRAQRFCQLFTYNVICYLASFPGNASTRNHSAWEDNDHCVADNVDNQNYECRHVDQDCKCAHVSTAPIEEVKAIIRQRGGIPLISFSETPTGVLTQKIIPANHFTKYVAVSHVWKDGLGNPRENALPEFQIRNILQIIRNSPLSKGQPTKRSLLRASRTRLNPTVNVWMDTYVSRSMIMASELKRSTA